MEERLQQVRDGLMDIEDLIQQYMPLASGVARSVQLRLRYPNYEELQAEAHFVLARVLNYAVVNSKEINVTYLKQRVTGSVYDYAFNDRDIKVSRWVNKDVNPECVPLNDEIVDSCMVGGEVQDTLTEDKPKYSLEDLIEALALSDQEKEILELRLDGYTVKEISKIIGTYDRAVRRILKRLQVKCRVYLKA